MPHVDPRVEDELANLLAGHGFFADLSSEDSGLLKVGSVLYRDLRLPPERRSRAGVLGGVSGELIQQRDDAIARYEAAVAEHDRLADRFNSLVREHRSLNEEAERRGIELARLTAELENLQLRRRAESLSAFEVEREFTAVGHELANQRLLLAAAVSELDALNATKIMRYSRHLRNLYGRLRRLRRRPRPTVAELATAEDVEGGDYDLWIETFDTIDDNRRHKIADRLARLDQRPTVSVLLPVFDPPVALLRRAIESVQGQLYPNWQLCLVDDASRDPAVQRTLDEYSLADARIQLLRREENGHIAAASNSALSIARGEWVVPLDHDDELTEHALAMAVLAAAEHPSAGLVYSDEDKIDETGKRFTPFFKPDFDPLRLLSQNYVCHMTMMRRDLVERAGGYKVGTEGSQDWDLVLRLTELLQPEDVVHVPHVLYHWRAHSASTAMDLASKPYAIRNGGKAVAEHLRRRGLAAETITNGATGLVRVKWHLPEHVPKVSIVIPTRDSSCLMRCVESLVRGTGYANYEVVIVDNGSQSKATLDFLRRSESWLKVIRDERDFNFSALNNMAVGHCDGEVICLLNDDCEIIHYDWLEEMVSQLLQDGVGAVGAKLLYGDGRIQHGGTVLGIGGVAGHAHKYADRLATGHFSRLLVPHSLSAVTAACMVVRRAAFEQVGGMDEVNLPIAFNDVDFCIRLREAGWRIVWSPFAELFHLESVSRGDEEGPRAEGFAREVWYMKRRWGDLLRDDPYYNPNLTLQHQGFSLAFPPRVSW